MASHSYESFLVCVPGLTGNPSFQVMAVTAAAVASQQLWPSGKAFDVSEINGTDGNTHIVVEASQWVVIL